MSQLITHAHTHAQNPARLITIPVSHYCEKARWALIRAQIPFSEERHMPPFHRLATQQVSNQFGSRVLTTTERNTSPLNRFVSRRIGGQTVPILVTATGILTSSVEILRWVDTIASDQAKLYPSNPEVRQRVEKLVTVFDSVLAPAVRQWVYFHILSQAQLVRPLWCQGVPWFERLLFPLVFRWMGSNVFEMYKINAKSVVEAYERICETFKMVESLLIDGRTYLVGEQFSAADLTFVTLAAAAVMPMGYGIALPELSQLPSQMSVDIQAFRETRAGKFVLRLYEEHERTVQPLTV
jgi:glutathione S-transferase